MNSNSHNHDIVVIGGSAGGFEAERERADAHHNFADHLAARAQEHARDAELVRRLLMDHNRAIDPPAGENDVGARIAGEENERR